MIKMKNLTAQLLFGVACLLLATHGRVGGGGHHGGGDHHNGGDHHDGNHHDGSHPPTPGGEMSSFENGVQEAIDFRQKARDKEREIASNNKQVNGRSASGKHLSLGRVRPALLRIGQNSAGLGKAAARMKEDNYEPDNVFYGDTSYGQEVCLQSPDCSGFENEKYRTMDGSCNNIAHGLWGMAGTEFSRLLSPAYGDKHKKYRPRSRAANGNKLKSARYISRNTFGIGEVLDSKLSLMAMQYGQFLDHDITLTPVNTILNDNETESGIICCENGQAIPKHEAHEECYPIDVMDSDPMYAEFGSCVNFVRSLPVPDNACLLKARQQMNAITSFLDASNIYGSSNDEASQLRQGTGGLLRTQDGDILPAAPATDECGIVDGKSCFLAGDARANEQIGLTMKHILWMREHNRIAKYLGNTMTDDEAIYQLARKIVIAEWQHITYNEYLRTILGETFMEANDLLPETDINGNYPFFPNYDNSLNPSIFNSFATSAYRFGHTMIKGIIETYKESGLHQSQELKSLFFAPYDLYDSDYRDELCRGFGRSNAHKVDSTVTDQVREHLFEEEGATSGLDLVAFNIQRGRDHGLPPYNEYREYCGLNKIESFSEFSSQDFNLDPDGVDRLRDAYDNQVHEIDVFVGGMIEKPKGDAQVGPTFKCLIGKQFKNLKYGDRYFYDNNQQPDPFTEAQLRNIKSSVSLAGIMCENAPNIEKLQRNMFLQADTSPDLVDCSTIDRIDLSLYV